MSSQKQSSEAHAYFVPALGT